MLPQVIVEAGSSPTSKGTPRSTGTGFFTGQFQKGPVNEDRYIRNIAHLEKEFGVRTSDSALDFDSIQAFFEEGGVQAWVSRYVGPAAKKAVATLTDIEEADSLLIEAASEGVWGNDLNIVIKEEGEEFTVAVQDEQAKVLAETAKAASPAAAVALINGSNAFKRLITAKALGGANPEAGTTAMAGGDDDLDGVTITEQGAALDLHVADRGPGTVMMPGRTTEAVHDILREHGAARNRVVKLDLPDTSTVGTLTAAAAAVTASEDAEFCATFWPWAKIPGIAKGTERTVPYSAIQAGIEARNDSLGVPQNQVSAGEYGVARYAIGLSQPALSEADMETLYDAGINIIRDLSGELVTYGDKTLVDPEVDDSWIDMGNMRLRMAIVADALEIGQRYIFKQIDGKGQLLSEFGGALIGMLLPYYNNNSLFGATFEEAARVDVSDAVNTPESLAEKKIQANIMVRMSLNSELVKIPITKVRNTEAV